MRRIGRHHVPLAIATVGGTALLATAVGSAAAIRPWSLATAYAGLALLSATLLIGPVRLRSRRRVAVSDDLRRDVGIWAAIAGIAHVVFGLQVHHPAGGLVEYFVAPASGRPAGLPLRADVFGFANYTGLVAVAILALLLALSNDLSLSRLGSRRWKFVHRFAYPLFALVIVHGALYQDAEQRLVPVLGLLLSATAVVSAAQLAGVALRRRGAGRSSGAAATRA